HAGSIAAPASAAASTSAATAPAASSTAAASQNGSEDIVPAAAARYRRIASAPSAAISAGIHVARCIETDRVGKSIGLFHRLYRAVIGRIPRSRIHSVGKKHHCLSSLDLAQLLFENVVYSIVEARSVAEFRPGDRVFQGVVVVCELAEDVHFFIE